MSNILLVEPSYRSKFPPLGLMKISAFHKERGDSVTFVRGNDPYIRSVPWDRVYVSSLFTYELPRTVQTIRYYQGCVQDPENLLVGGIAATLIPSYITDRVKCTVVSGLLDKPGMLGEGSPPIDTYVPDYSLIDSIDFRYKPEDTYFCKISKGCIRNCGFCAVPKLEPCFGYRTSLRSEIAEVDRRYGEKQHLVLMDNNVLALDSLDDIVREICSLGFGRGARRNGRRRTVDFNQGIDARLIDERVANLLAMLCLDPIRLAFDWDGMEHAYRGAVQLLSDRGFREFTTYVMFNYNDTPGSLYRRLRVNLELRAELGVRVTGFPMRYIPVDDIDRHFVSSGWTWRILRGIQCILLATHGMVSPNPVFFERAFGRTEEEFIEVTSMPDRYIIHREEHENNGAAEWRSLYRRMSHSERNELMRALEVIHYSKNRQAAIRNYPEFRSILAHYYPDEVSGDPHPSLLSEVAVSEE